MREALLKPLKLAAILLLLAAPVLAYGTPEEEQMRQTIEQFMRQYDPNRSYGTPSSSGTYSQGSDLLSLFIKAYNIARQFIRNLPPIYLEDVTDVYAIRNKILDRSTYELTLVSGKVAKLPRAVVSAIQERAFIPDRTYPSIKINWAMPKEDLAPYKAWEKRQGLRAELYLVARGEDATMDALGITEALGFGFMMLNSDLYLFTANGYFFKVQPGPAGAFIPWFKLAMNQIQAAKAREGQ